MFKMEWGKEMIVVTEPLNDPESEDDSELLEMVIYMDDTRATQKKLARELSTHTTRIDTVSQMREWMLGQDAQFSMGFRAVSQ